MIAQTKYKFYHYCLRRSFLKTHNKLKVNLREGAQQRTCQNFSRHFEVSEYQIKLALLSITTLNESNKTLFNIKSVSSFKSSSILIKETLTTHTPEVSHFRKMKCWGEELRHHKGISHFEENHHLPHNDEKFFLKIKVTRVLRRDLKEYSWDRKEGVIKSRNKGFSDLRHLFPPTLRGWCCQQGKGERERCDVRMVHRK